MAHQFSNDPDLSTHTKHDLECLKIELEGFFQSRLYQVFIGACQTNQLNIVDGALSGTLRGVESLFTRESLLGESQGWKNMQNLFLELLEDVNTEIKRK